MEEQTQQVEQPTNETAPQAGLAPELQLELLHLRQKDRELDLDSWKFIINNVSFDKQIKSIAMNLLLEDAFRSVPKAEEKPTPKLEVVKRNTKE